MDKVGYYQSDQLSVCFLSKRLKNQSVYSIINNGIK